MPQVLAYIGDIIYTYAAEAEISEAVVTAVGYALEYVAVAEILNKAEQALSPSSKTGIGANLQANYYSSEASLRIIGGTVRVGGMQTIPPITYGTNGEYLAGVLTLAGHEVNAITDCYFDANIIADASIGPITGAESDGLVASGTYQNLAWVRRYTGTATQAVDYILNTDVSPGAFTSDFRGRGIAYAATQLKFDPTAYPQIPNQTYLVEGLKLYDPRLDSTVPGGSGSQRAATPSTWTFSSNPVLFLATYLMSDFGGEYDPSEIDWSTVIVAANVCDFSLTGAVTPPAAVQNRFTFNGALLATEGGGGQAFSDNVQTITNSFLGRTLYMNGIWSIFAGGWQTPNAVSINKNDWVSGLQIGFEQGRDKRFNEAHCWFIDPNQNWQRVECYPRVNAAYVAADGNESIPMETDQPFCTVENEAQRKAEFLLRQSRNQITVSGKLPPRFQGIKLWDTLPVNYDDLGWSGKTFRVAGCTINPDGSIDVSLAEEQASDWNDLATGEYNNPSTAMIPTTKGTRPSAPGEFTVQVTNGTLSFEWQPPVVLPKGTRYRLLSYPGSLSNQSSKQVIWQGDATHAVLQTTNNAPFYVQVQAFVNSDFSGLNPNTYGIQVAPNYVQAGVSSWSAYLSGFQSKAGTAASLTAGPLTALVNSPTSPVFSWTLVGSNGIVMNFGVGSAGQTFTGSMAVGVSLQALAACHVVDGSNNASLSALIVLGRSDGSGTGGGGNA